MTGWLKGEPMKMVLHPVVWPEKAKSRLESDGFAHVMVPRKGLEPPRSYSLVPETSASTNSATWAFQERKALYQKI